MQINQFTKNISPNGAVYYSFLKGDKEICLESCFGGFDVAIYKNKELLLENKLCTDHEGYTDIFFSDRRTETINRALEIATELYKNYCV